MSLSIVAALSPDRICTNVVSNGADAQNTRVQITAGPTVIVLVPTTTWPPHWLQSALIPARPSAIWRLNVAVSGGGTADSPGSCRAMSSQVPPMRSAMGAVLEGLVGPEHAPHATAVNRATAPAVKPENCRIIGCVEGNGCAFSDITGALKISRAEATAPVVRTGRTSCQAATVGVLGSGHS